MADYRSTKEKKYKQYIDFDIIQAYEDLIIVLENLKPDLFKATTVGSHTCGIRSRASLKVAKKILKQISKNALLAEKEAKKDQPPHPNKGKMYGVHIMLNKRNVKLKTEKEK